MKNLSKKEITTISGGGPIKDFIDVVNDGVRAYRRIKEFFSGRPQT